MKVWLQMGAGAVLAGLLLASGSQAGTSDVYRLQTVIRGVTQWDLNNNPGTPRAATVQIRDVDLINLGLGQPLTNHVPANAHLALVTQCASDDMRIIVYDGTRNLMTIGKLQTVSVVENLPGKPQTRNVIATLTFTNLTNAVTFATANGSVSNCLAGGEIFRSRLHPLRLGALPDQLPREHPRRVRRLVFLYQHDCHQHRGYHGHQHDHEHLLCRLKLHGQCREHGADRGR